MSPTFFPTPAKLRAWLKKHYATERELLVGFYKKDSGRKSITWPESVDEALCFGWIDGIRKRIDEVSYTIRFTPRRPGSNWSKVNIERATELIRAGRMQPAGLAAFEAREKGRSAGYSYEQRSPKLDQQYEAILRKDEAAWAFFASQPPFYRKGVSAWISSAKREETRLRRLEKLRGYSAQGERIPEFLDRKPSR